MAGLGVDNTGRAHSKPDRLKHAPAYSDIGLTFWKSARLDFDFRIISQRRYGSGKSGCWVGVGDTVC